MCVSPTSIHETCPHTTTSGVTFLCFYVSRKELELSSICISSSPWTVTSLKGVLENSIFSTLLYFQWHFSIFMIFSTTDVSWMVFQLNCPQASSDHTVLQFLIGCQITETTCFARIGDSSLKLCLIL